MTFASPIALLFLGLFLPVILLYLLKQRRRQVQVSTLMFWDKILRDEQSVTSMTKLKKLLSLLLQLLFIALLSFAVARPLLSGKVSGARRVVLLLDTSASMLVQEGSQTRFDLAREKAIGVIRGLSLGDAAMVIAVAAQPDLVHPFTDSKKALEEAVNRLQPLHSDTNFREALQMVRQLPRDDRPTDVYLISDGAFDPVEIPDPPTNTFFAWLRVGAETENLGITAFQVRPLPHSSRDFQVHLELSNWTKADRKVPVELRMGGRLLDAYELSIPAGQSTTRTLRQFSAEGGPIEAFVDFKDAFPLDNRAFAVLPRPEPVKVRLVTPGNPFLERALATDDSVELQVLEPDQFQPAPDAAITIFSGWSPPATPRGNSIFIGAWPEDLGLVKRGELAKPIFTDWDRESPVNRHLSLQNVTIEKALAVTPAPGFQKLAASFGDPLVLLRESAEENVLVIAFDTGHSDLPLRVAFPVLIGNAIRYLARSETAERWASPPMGSILGPTELARFAAIGTNALRAVVGPSRARHSVNEGTLVPVSFAGVYEGEVDGGESVPLFAANLASRAESRIVPATSLPLRSGQPLAELKGGARLGFEPWIALALLGLVLSTVEWGLFHRRVIE